MAGSGSGLATPNKATIQGKKLLPHNLELKIPADTFEKTAEFDDFIWQSPSSQSSHRRKFYHCGQSDANHSQLKSVPENAIVLFFNDSIDADLKESTEIYSNIFASPRRKI
jgi:hypothetical protein